MAGKITPFFTSICVLKGSGLCPWLAALVLALAGPQRVAADDLYVGLQNSDSVVRISDQGVVSTFATGVPRPVFLIEAPNGNLLAQNESGPIYQITRSGVVSHYADAGSGPDCLAFDAQGTLYAGNKVDGTVLRQSKDGSFSVYARGFNKPMGLAFDAQGVLTVIDMNQRSMSKVAPNGVIQSTPLPIPYPIFIAYDSVGDAYIPNLASGTIVKINQAGAISTFASGLGEPASLIFSRTGDLYVSDPPGGRVFKVTKAGVVSLLASGLNYPIGLTFLHRVPANQLPSGAPQIPRPAAGVILVLLLPAILLCLGAIIWIIAGGKRRNSN